MIPSHPLSFDYKKDGDVHKKRHYCLISFDESAKIAEKATEKIRHSACITIWLLTKIILEQL